MSVGLRVQRAQQWVFLVLDRSSSMSGDRLEAAKDGAVAILETLQDGDMLAIFTFNHEVQQLIELTEINTLKKVVLLLAVKSITAGMHNFSM
jgi:Ca-activated chloride channel family protein